MTSSKTAASEPEALWAAVGGSVLIDTCGREQFAFRLAVGLAPRVSNAGLILIDYWWQSRSVAVQIFKF